MLGLSTSFTARELRQAYLQAAKLSHPDLNRHTSRYDFQAVTEAYEFLSSQQKQGTLGDDLGITAQEEEYFRESCQDWLGVSADVVEESKKCPMFREWLQGKTDAAMLWNSFFSLHGGLAPMLRPPAALLEGEGVTATRTRRKRK
eukprot:CAMPEP_0194201418 /NCGR_PEP_ID=MMETSP0156-20130528/1695_1 /TAXON_ID=33649 /ORGANISM="Thalassionema nitzschioides, Strain L26-B" /LENGTH=144 /DNA_ID=CAMNT_0038926605 /DNA_START=247 /DNA_END=681 /DNA_ORIENTATION=+